MGKTLHFCVLLVAAIVSSVTAASNLKRSSSVKNRPSHSEINEITKDPAGPSLKRQTSVKSARPSTSDTKPPPASKNILSRTQKSGESSSSTSAAKDKDQSSLKIKGKIKNLARQLCDKKKIASLFDRSNKDKNEEQKNLSKRSVSSRPHLPSPHSVSKAAGKMTVKSSSSSTASPGTPKASLSRSNSRTLPGTSNDGMSMAELQQLFAKYDTDCDGQITKEELRRMLQALNLPCTESQLDEAMKALDTDGNGTIDIQEFRAVMPSKKGMEQEQRDAFKVFDADHDGYLTPEDLKRVMDSVGDPTNLEDSKLMISYFDKNGDGRIDIDEFLTMMRS